jgi:hypothetical protein
MTVLLLLSHRDALVNMELLDFDRFYQLQLLFPFPILDASLHMGKSSFISFSDLGGGSTGQPGILPYSVSMADEVSFAYLVRLDSHSMICFPAARAAPLPETMFPPPFQSMLLLVSSLPQVRAYIYFVPSLTVELLASISDTITSVVAVS